MFNIEEAIKEGLRNELDKVSNELIEKYIKKLEKDMQEEISRIQANILNSVKTIFKEGSDKKVVLHIIMGDNDV